MLRDILELGPAHDLRAQLQNAFASRERVRRRDETRNVAGSNRDRPATVIPANGVPTERPAATVVPATTAARAVMRAT